MHDPVPTLAEGPRGLKRLLARMMAKSPDARHADYGELLKDIERMLAARSRLIDEDAMARPAGVDCGELVEECRELLTSLQADIPSIQQGAQDKDTLARMQRSAHTAKGLIGFLEIPEMNRLATELTEDLRRLRDGETELTRESADRIAADTTKLTALLAATTNYAGHSEPGGGTSWGDLQGSASRGRVAALSKAITEVLGTFNVGGVFCDEDVPGKVFTTARDLTAVVNARDALDAAIIFEFDHDVAGKFAHRMASAMTGEEVEITSREETEFVRGALGEVINFTVLATLSALGLPPTALAPRFVEGKGVGLCPSPMALRRFSVETDIGSFDVGYVPGATLGEAAGAGGGKVETGSRSLGRVVVADDSLVMRKMLERLLVEAGYEVVAHAKDGREAIEQFRRHRPDLITMDISMPVMGGLDALRIIRAEDPAARVLICSAITEDGMIRRSLTSGAVGYMTKPFNPTKLLQTVNHLLNEHQPESGTVHASASALLDVRSLGIYRVGTPLGEGGMAVVYEGYDPGLGRKVALKVINDEFADDVDFVVQFLEEARAIAGVSDPNVVSVYFAGSDKGKHFFAMELLPGPDLEELVNTRGPVPFKKALSCVRQGALGLAAAARSGLIHCDVKPSNLVFDSCGVIKVTDFGIAQHIGTKDDPTISEMIGTPCFMSPEQVLARPIDHRSDIYSLGATLYFLLTGQPPYEGEDGVEVALRHVHDPVPTLAMGPRKLGRLLSRMMAKSPDDRHADYGELLKDIERLL